MKKRYDTKLFYPLICKYNIMTSKEQKRPADIFEDALDYLWNGLGLEGNGWKRLKKGDFKKKMKNGLTYQIWFDRSHYNYIDYEIGVS